MMNRAGIGSLMRAGPAPGRAGLSHLARGEAVIPNAAMNADPSLRQRAMMAMASRGRNPSQFTVGQRNLRNPSTGMPMFADLVYVDGQYVDASTGQPANFGGGGGFADLGTNTPSSPSAPGYSPAGIDGAAIARSLGLNPSVAQGVGTPEEIDRFIQATQNFTRQVVAPARQQEYWSDPNQAVDFAHGGGRLTVSDMGPGWRSSGGYKAAGIDAALPDATVSSPTFGIGDSDVGTPEAAANYGFGTPSSSQSYDEWRMSRNPSGKNVPNTLFGQTQTAGGNAGFSTGGMEMPNVLAGQMPVAGASWGTPGTALGFGRENTANDPSILRSGYNDLSLSPSIYSAAFGANGLMGPQSSGIAFSGQNPMTSGQNGQQNQYGTPYGAFDRAFRY